MKAPAFVILAFMIFQAAVGVNGANQYGFMHTEFLRTEGYDFQFQRAEGDTNHWQMGFFRFRWNGNYPIRLWGYGFEKDGSFRVRFEIFSRLTADKWEEVPVGYCGTGMRMYEIKSKTNYVLKIPLWPYEKIGTKGVIKIDGEKIAFISKPFDVAPLRKQRQPDSPANGRQPIRSATNRTAVAVDSRH
jgi:hypothetical protein